MERVLEKEDKVYVTKNIPYKKIKEFPDRILKKCFEFAYNIWNEFDLRYNGYKISFKSTKL